MARLNVAALALLSSTSSFLTPKPLSFSLRLNSLSDQLSQLSYDGAFTGKMSGALKLGSAAKVSAAPVVEKAAQESFNIPNVQDLLKEFKLDAPDLHLPPVSLPALFNVPEMNLPNIDIPSFSLESVETAIQTLWADLQQALPILSTIDPPPAVLLLASSILSFSLINTVLTWGSSPPPSTPYPMGKYDPISARRYFDSRPLEVFKRAVEVTLLSGAFLVGLASDAVAGKLDGNADMRAKELSVLLTKLGPSFIKVSR